MATFYDASCDKCGRRFGWQGELTDRPNCPRCGHRPPDKELADAQAKMDDFERMLIELRQANPGWDKWQKARVAAGLTLRQAAKLLEVAPQTLCDIEQGRQKPSEALAKRMGECYGG